MLKVLLKCAQALEYCLVLAVLFSLVYHELSFFQEHITIRSKEVILPPLVSSIVIKKILKMSYYCCTMYKSASVNFSVVKTLITSS